MSDLSSPELLSVAVPSAILLASLLGSLHCVGMCGGLALSIGQTRRGAALYHLGRLLAYVGGGALSGFLGRSLLGPSVPAWMTLGSATLLAAVLIWTGLRSWRGNSPHLSFPGPFGRWMARATVSRNSFAGLWVGLLTAFLPCGWLHSFFLAAVASQSAGRGALILLLFWVGTVPALAGSQLAARTALQPLASKAPKIAAVLLVASGFWTLGTKVAPALLKKPAGESCPHHQPSSHHS